ncbi:hypothetical protein AVEN_149864-1 [Araneus ventricosus]|uniref:Uncharacterized protein n=1 Tax=Araneus ventricosus TaxID=182803 RepID=A0A4Y2DY59_ARAVE|nr:hypothetical protein AVEN_149864-1 [Araneus ventricosus]
MLNRDSSVKSTWPHCSGVQLRCSRAQCNGALKCAGNRGTQTTGRRENSPPSCSLRYTVWRDMGLSAAAESYALSVSSGVCTLQQVAIVCRCGDSPASRSTSSTGVLIPFHSLRMTL